MPLRRKKLLGILAGPWLAQGLYALVKLGVPDLLGEGSATAHELARKTGAVEPALERLLNALATAGLLSRVDKAYALTSTTLLLRSDVEGSVRLNVLMQGDEIYRSFAEIMHTMQTGQPAFEKVYGQPFYDYLSSNPEAGHTFHASMGNQQAPAAFATCDLSDARTVVDVGGGDGTLLIELLERYPQLNAVLLDLPAATAHAPRSRRLAIVEGSFFDRIPADGDVYVLSRVLHNWTDERALHILRNIKEAMPAHGRLIVLEEFHAGMVDLLMLLTLEGRDRTEDEYHALLTQAGFAVYATRPGVIEARRDFLPTAKAGGFRPGWPGRGPVRP